MLGSFGLVRKRGLPLKQVLSFINLFVSFCMNRSQLWSFSFVLLAAGFAFTGCQDKETEVEKSATDGDSQGLRTLVEKTSVYNHYLIKREGDVVQMRHRRRSKEWVESAVNVVDPIDIVVPYKKTIFAGLMMGPAPENVLMIGLGGGGFNRPFNAAYPESVLATAEIDPMSRDLAIEYMKFEPSDKNIVIIKDGRLFVRKDKRVWDWIILDAFNAGDVPPHLKTQEFYKECASRLSAKGLLISNLHGGNALYYADIQTMKETFQQLVLFRVPRRGNVISFAAKYSSPSLKKQIEEFISEGVPELLTKQIDFEAMKGDFIDWQEEIAKMKKKWGTEEDPPVLTDDFSPAEYLKSLQR